MAEQRPQGGTVIFRYDATKDRGPFDAFVSEAVAAKLEKKGMGKIVSNAPKAKTDDKK